jgi:carboxypeptidase family protein
MLHLLSALFVLASASRPGLVAYNIEMLPGGFVGQIGQISPGTISAPPQQQQQAPVTPGTATLRGHIFAADSGQPLRKAQVRIFAGEIRENRMATTDQNGAYEFKEVRAGRYTVSASKGSYVSISYGQQRPTDASKPLEILDNQLVERLDLSLPRGSIVTGRILDEFGEPAPEIQVALQRYMFTQGQRRLVPFGRMATTNDIGEFRLFGIPPGQYYISATWRNLNMAPNANPNDRTAYAPTYFPGTTSVNDAQRITLLAGQELNNVLMALNPIKAARVSGTATGADGKPMTQAMIMVSQSNGGFGFTMSGAGQVRPDGTFTIVGIAPGDYTLRVQRMGPPSPDGPETAMASITVNGEDISDVHLVAAKPSKITGRVVVDPAAVAALPPVLMISVFPVSPSGIPAPPPPPARVADDFTFETKSTPGRMRFALGGGFNAGPTGWTVRTVRLNSIDVTDAGVEIKANEDVSVEVELTNKLTTVSGLVTNARGDASKDYTTIVFAQDKDKWTGNSRYQNMGRPDQDGRFKITGLPPGEYYIIAIDHLDPGQQSDPDFLESVRSRASSLSLNEGETKTVNLRLNSAP